MILAALFCNSCIDIIKTSNVVWQTIDLCHSVAMLSLRRIKRFVFVQTQCEASSAKTKLFIPRDSTWLLSDKGL